MSRYLLDTNAVIALLNDPSGVVAQHARRHRPNDIAISSLVAHELCFGAFKSRRRQHNLSLVDELRFEVVPFDHDDARQSAEIRAALAARGTPIGAYDVLIAGQAVARGITLITNNTTEFERVPALIMENWYQP